MTPLNWAVVTGKDSKYQNIADLRGTIMGVSRIGRLARRFFFIAHLSMTFCSGSHTMANVMALQHGAYMESLFLLGVNSHSITNPLDWTDPATGVADEIKFQGKRICRFECQNSC